MDYDHPYMKGSGIPRQPSNRARQAAFRLDIGRGGFVMDQVGTWRQNEMRRDVHQEKSVVEWWHNEDITYLFMGIYLIIPAE